jgi:hypothetical protein
VVAVVVSYDFVCALGGEQPSTSCAMRVGGSLMWLIREGEEEEDRGAV